MLQTLQSVNRILILLVAGSLLLWGLLFVMPVQEVEWEASAVTVQPLPKNAFEQEAAAYAAIDGPALHLNFNPPSEQLPDLRPYLTYYGKDWRPDANPEQQQLHFGLKGTSKSSDLISVKPGEKVYLSYETQKDKGGYLFSERETSFWFVPSLKGEQLEVLVYLQHDDGEVIEGPEEFHALALEEKELPRFGGGKWTLGSTRVDGSLLARQRSRWFGTDFFLEEHGGEEYAERAAKQRMQVGIGEGAYVVYIGADDYLIWKDDRWVEAELGEATRGYPLLKLDKVEERMLRFELWDDKGQQKIAVNLVKSNEMWRFPGSQKIRFVGARTRTHSILEFDGQRIIVGPDEWLLREDGGWIKLDSVEEIDDYVSGRLIGELFVCEGVQRRDGQQFFAAHAFNSSRSQMELLELSAQSDEVRVVDPDAREAAPSEASSSDKEETPLERLEKIINLPPQSKLDKRKRRSSIIERSSMIRRELQRGEGYPL